MWLSASAFFHQYYRVYSPVAFGKKTDKTGAYIRWVIPRCNNKGSSKEILLIANVKDWNDRHISSALLHGPPVAGLARSLWLVNHPNILLAGKIDGQTVFKTFNHKVRFVLNVWSKYSLRSKFGRLKMPVFISIYLTQICYRFCLLLKYRVEAVLENWPPFHSQLCYAVKVL